MLKIFKTVSDFYKIKILIYIIYIYRLYIFHTNDTQQVIIILCFFVVVPIFLSTLLHVGIMMILVFFKNYDDDSSDIYDILTRIFLY